MLKSAKEIDTLLKIVWKVYDNLPFNRLLGLSVSFLEIDRAGLRVYPGLFIGTGAGKLLFSQAIQLFFSNATNFHYRSIH